MKNEKSKKDPHTFLVFGVFDFTFQKTGQKYAKLIKWPKITFRGLNLVPEMAFWGFWGLVCIEKWSQNFDSGTRTAIFDTPKNAKAGSFWRFLGTENGISGARIKILRPFFNTN